MKKIVSIILAMIIFISLITLTTVLNINMLTKYETIHKISSKINYLDLVNIKTNKNDLQEIYDEIYLSFQEYNIPPETIKQFYNQEFFAKVTTKIIYTESNYFLTGKELKTYTLEELNNLAKENIHNIKKISKDEEELLNTLLERNNQRILTIENIIRSRINNMSYYKIKLIRYILDYKFKVILLCLMIISILLEYIINKEKLLPYIFIPTIICSVLELIISIFIPNIFSKTITNNFLEFLVYPYIKMFANNLLFTALLLLLISIFYLIINEKMTAKLKKIIKPKITKKNNYEMM